MGAPWPSRVCIGILSLAVLPCSRLIPSRQSGQVSLSPHPKRKPRSVSEGIPSVSVSRARLMSVCDWLPRSCERDHGDDTGEQARYDGEASCEGAAGRTTGLGQRAGGRSWWAWTRRHWTGTMKMMWARQPGTLERWPARSAPRRARSSAGPPRSARAHR
jgi:hypothetical protein